MAARPLGLNGSASHQALRPGGAIKVDIPAMYGVRRHVNGRQRLVVANMYGARKDGATSRAR